MRRPARLPLRTAVITHLSDHVGLLEGWDHSATQGELERLSDRVELLEGCDHSATQGEIERLTSRVESLEKFDHSGTQGELERLNSRVAALEQQLEQFQAEARRQVSSQAVTGAANVQQDRPKAQRVATNPPRSSKYSKEPFLGIEKSEWVLVIKFLLLVMVLAPLFMIAFSQILTFTDYMVTYIIKSACSWLGIQYKPVYNF